MVKVRLHEAYLFGVWNCWRLGEWLREDCMKLICLEFGTAGDWGSGYGKIV